MFSIEMNILHDLPRGPDDDKDSFSWGSALIYFSID